MKFLIFGDLHGNLPALEKLLKVEEGNYDAIVCHGDVVNYGPWSNECVELLAELPNIRCLKGNHEEAFLKGEYHGKNEVAKAFFLQCFPQFFHQKLISRYDNEVVLKDYVVKHTLKETYIYPDTDLSQFELDQNYVIGHSHYQFDRQFGDRRLINTGSLGQDRKFINRGNYLVYDEKSHKVELKNFTFDLDIVLKEMKNQNYPLICLDYYRNKKRA